MRPACPRTPPYEGRTGFHDDVVNPAVRWNQHREEFLCMRIHHDGYKHEGCETAFGSMRVETSLVPSCILECMFSRLFQSHRPAFRLCGLKGRRIHLGL